jgi:hypothetical protein
MIGVVIGLVGEGLVIGVVVGLVGEGLVVGVVIGLVGEGLVMGVVVGDGEIGEVVGLATGVIVFVDQKGGLKREHEEISSVNESKIAVQIYLRISLGINSSFYSLLTSISISI